MRLSNRTELSLIPSLLTAAALLFAPPLANAQEVRPAESPTFQDWGQGLSWHRQRAESGDAAAQYRYGRLLEEGVQTAPDLAAARDWYRRAAEQGHADSQFRLATMLQMGQGGPADATAAAKWYRKAAHQGIAKAAYNLAVILERQGEPGQAAPYYAQAAQAGVGQAAANLAVLYLDGRGVAQDGVKALTWMIIAEEAGVLGAESARETIASTLSAEEQSQARAQIPLFKGS